MEITTPCPFVTVVVTDPSAFVVLVVVSLDEAEPAPAAPPEAAPEPDAPFAPIPARSCSAEAPPPTPETPLIAIPLSKPPSTLPPKAESPVNPPLTPPSPARPDHSAINPVANPTHPVHSLRTDPLTPQCPASRHRHPPARKDKSLNDAVSPAPWREEDRLAALRAYRILDTPPEPEFDDLVQTAARACGAPLALLTFLDADRQWPKAGFGFPHPPTALPTLALSEGDLLVIPDTTADPDFATQPLVADVPHTRFYAAALLRTPGGLPVGTLAVLDHTPRELTPEQRFVLQALARAAIALLEGRKAIIERDIALLAERRAETRSQQILNSAVDYAIISFDIAGRITSWNEGARRILGWTEAEMLGQPADRIFTPEDTAEGRPAIEMGEALRCGAGNDERWHVRADGSRFYALGEMMPLRDDAGTVTGFMKILRDRTEQRHATRILRDTQARIEIALGTGLVGFFDWHVPTGILRGDARLALFYGLDEARIAEGVPLSEIESSIHPDDREAVTETLAGALRRGGDYAKRFRVLHAGAVRHLMARGRCDEHDGTAPVHYTGVVVDITASKTAEAAALESESRYRSLFNSIDQGFCIVEVLFDGDRPADYRFLEANAAFERQTGLLGAAGRTMRSFAPDHEEYWFETYGRIALTGEPERFQHAARSLEDRFFDVYAFRVDAPELRHVAVLFNDVSASRRAQEVLARSRDELQTRVADSTVDLARTREALEREAAERLQAEEALRQSQKMEAVGQLTGGLAHDFNNLLAGITGSLEMLGTRVVQGRLTEVDRYIAAAQNAATRAAALTHRLLAFSRRQTLDPRPTDANRLIAGMEELIRRTVGPEITVETVGAGSWPILVDPNQLENALLNLCINARDAMPNGGRITVETADRHLDERTAPSRDLAPGHYLSLSVTDTGVGMPPDIIARAFDPFFTTKPIGQGTGLGLSMVYGFVRQSGGQIRIHSQPGLGTTMRLYFPRHLGQSEGAAEQAARPDAAPVRNGETILVVDDEPTVRFLVREVLEDLGYVTMEAGDGAAGLRILQTGVRIDLLVTDVGLPGGLNGRQMADAARLVRPDLKVLFITGYAENAVVGQLHLESGMRVLGKPFKLDALTAQVRSLLQPGALPLDTAGGERPQTRPI